MNFLRSIVLAAVVAVVLGRSVVWAGTLAGEDWMSELLDELDLGSVDERLDRRLPEKLTFSSLVSSLAGENGEELGLRALGDYVLDLLFYELAAARPIFVELLCICLLFAVFGKVLVTRQSYVNSLGFFAVYAGVMLLLMNSFLLVKDVVYSGVEELLSFMSAFVPIYAAALLFSGNLTSAGVFYELAFGLIYLLELAIKLLFIPGVHIFVLLVMMDNFFEEAKLSKLADLIESGIRTALRLALAAVVGLGVVQSLIAPAKDRLSANGVFRTMEALPGVGNSFGAAGEILVGCGILIKNSAGTAALVILVILSASPILSVAAFHVMYRLVGALLQPFADRRISECVHGVGRGCGLYLTIVVDSMLLLFITISMISASTSFIY